MGKGIGLAGQSFCLIESALFKAYLCQIQPEPAIFRSDAQAAFKRLSRGFRFALINKLPCLLPDGRGQGMFRC